MTPDDIVDPLRPVQRLSDALRDTIHLRPGAQRDITPDIAQLLGTWRWAQSLDPAAPILARDLVSLCNHLDALAQAEPEPIMLADAPRIDRRCAAVVDNLPVPVGVVTGHPRLREGARTMTSPLIRIALDKGWARTFSRYNLLGRPDRAVLAALRAEGGLRADAQFFNVPIAGGWT